MSTKLVSARERTIGKECQEEKEQKKKRVAILRKHKKRVTRTNTKRSVRADNFTDTIQWETANQQHNNYLQ